MVEHEGDLRKDTPLLCVRCKKNKAAHLEPVVGRPDYQEESVCDDCFVVEFPSGFSIEWVNDIGMSKRDRRYCMLGAKRAVVKKKYKWGEADIVGVAITVTDLDEEKVEFDVDFRVTEVVKSNGEVDKEAESRSQETEDQSGDKGPPSTSTGTKGEY